MKETIAPARGSPSIVTVPETYPNGGLSPGAQPLRKRREPTRNADRRGAVKRIEAYGN
jgi:hypothetical protein